MSGVITNVGKQIVLDRVWNTTPTRLEVSQFKLGTGTTTPTVTDTNLENPIPINNTETLESCDVADFTDSADMDSTLNTTTYKNGIGSINLTKSGTSSVVANVSKTEGGTLDFTSKQLSLWIYIIDSTALAKLTTTDAISIRIGSDGSNYYEWEINKSDLTTGWNYIYNKTSSNATTIGGSPTITAIDYVYLELTSNNISDVWSVGDIAMDDWILASTSDFTKPFEAGFPTLDYTTLEATVRGRINTLQANGQPISELGIFNADGSPLMFSRDQFTALNKTENSEFIFETRTLIQ